MNKKCGFTLIEISVVLIIIGLIIGGIMTGKSIKEAAKTTAQISQMQKYQQAVISFQTKYNGYLPGDIPNPYAPNFGFQSRGLYDGQGDGNGILKGNCSNVAGSSNSLQEGCGEPAVFWQDLSTAGLIDTNVPTGAGYPNISTPILGNCCVWPIGSPTILNNWLPTAKIGNGMFISVYSWNSINYFALQVVGQIGWNTGSTGFGAGTGINAMTVKQAYTIDQKIDDGLPQSGVVIACDTDYDVNGGVSPVWAAGNSAQGAGNGSDCTPTTAATPYLSTNCFDNNNIAGTQTYSITKNANAPNCALSFQFQTQ